MTKTVPMMLDGLGVFDLPAAGGEPRLVDRGLEVLVSFDLRHGGGGGCSGTEDGARGERVIVGCASSGERGRTVDARVIWPHGCWSREAF